MDKKSFSAPKPKAASPKRVPDYADDSDSDIGTTWKPSKALKTTSGNGAKNGDSVFDMAEGRGGDDSPVFGKKKATAKKPTATKRPATSGKTLNLHGLIKLVA